VAKSVKVYQGFEYNGQHLELGEGRYMRFVHVDVQPMSLRVPAGLKVAIAYAGYGMVHFDRDTPMIVGTRGMMTEIRVDDATANPPVRAYNDDYLCGAAAQLGVGLYNVDKLPFGDNRIRSLLVTPGHRVVVFADANFAGQSTTYGPGAWELGALAGRVSSLRVESLTLAPEVPRVTLFEDADFRGRSHALPIGRHDLGAFGLGNDAVSSIRVPPELQVVLFEHAKFTGRSIVVDADNPFLGAFNDQVSSLIVGTRQGPPATRVATIYEDRDFKGRSRQLAPGGYDLPELGLANDSLSSLRVPKGLRVILFEHSRYGGARLAFEADASNVGSFDNKTSSVVVEVVRAAPKFQITPTPRPKRPATPPGPAPTLAEAGDPNLLELKKLGELPFLLFTRAFKMPLRFDGGVYVSVQEQALTFSGTATLAEPFNMAVDVKARLVREAGAPEFMVRFGMASSLAELLTQKVRPEVSQDVWSVLDSTVVPFLEVFDRSSVIIASSDGYDDDLGGYVRGITFYAQVMGDTFEPFRRLNQTFPALELEKRSLVLSLGIRLPGGSGGTTVEAPTDAGAGAGTGTGVTPPPPPKPTTPTPTTPGGATTPATEDGEAAPTAGGLSFLLATELILDIPLVTPAVVFRSVGLTVNQRTTSLSGAATIGFELNLGPDTLQCRGSLAIEGEGAGKLTVWGAIDTADGMWKDPFGLRGLAFTGVGIQLSATPNFPYVVIGVRGGIHLGDNDLGGDIAVLVDSGNPAASILEVKSPEGIDLPRLVKAFLGTKLVAPSRVPRVLIKDLRILAAPMGGTLAGKYFAPGVALSGRIDLFGFDAFVEGELDLTAGIVLRGAMDPIVLRAQGFEVFSFTDVSGRTGPTVDLELSANRQGGTCNGKVRILGGLMGYTARAQIGVDGLDVSVAADSLGLDYDLRVALKRGLAAISFAPGLGVTIEVANRSFGLAVRAQVGIEVSAGSFKQAAKFRYVLFDRDETIGPVTISTPLRSIADLAAVFMAKCKGLVVDRLLAEIKAVTEAAIRWVSHNVSRALHEIGRFFKDAGASTADIARGMVRHLQAAPAWALRSLGVGLNEGVKLLRDVFGESAKDALRFAGGVPDITEQLARGALRGAGYAVKEVDDAFDTAGDWISDRFEDVGDGLEDFFTGKVF
jgi:hypothetical protein